MRPLQRKHYEGLLAFCLILIGWLGIWAINTKADQPYVSCTQVYADGLKNIPKNDPRAINLKDADSDGDVCDG